MSNNFIRSLEGPHIHLINGRWEVATAHLRSGRTMSLRYHRQRMAVQKALEFCVQRNRREGRSHR